MVMYSAVLFVFTSVALVVNSSYAIDGSHSVVDGLLREARELRLKGDMIGAEMRLSRAQRIDPYSADVYIELAHLFKDQGDFAGLREIVDYGAQVADGPPKGVSQLKALQGKLAILLPLDAETPFDFDPVAVATPPVAERETYSEAGSTVRSSDRKRGLQDKNDETNPDVQSTESKEKKRPPDLLQPKQSSPVGTATVSVSRKQQVEPLARVLDEKYAPSKEPQSHDRVEQAVVAHNIDQRIGKSHGMTTTGLKSDNPVVGKVGFFGVGILGKPQSGTWMSRGPIERDFN